MSAFHMPFRFGALSWTLVGPTYGAQCFRHVPMHVLSSLLLKRSTASHGFDAFNLGLLWADIENAPYSARQHALQSIAWGPLFAQRRSDRRNARLRQMNWEEVDTSWGSRPADRISLSRFPPEFVRAIAQVPESQVSGVVSRWSAREEIGLREADRAAHAPALEQLFRTLQQLATLSLTSRSAMFVCSLVP